MTVPYQFQNQSGRVPASELDDNFAYLDALVAAFLDGSADVDVATLKVSNPIIFAVNRAGASFSLANDTITVVDFTAEELDTNNSYDLATNRFTPPAGYYHFSGLATLLGGIDGGQLTCSLYKNGSAFCNGARVNCSDADIETGTVLSVELHLNGTDYVDFRVYQANGSSSAITMSGALNELRFSGYRIG